MTRTSLQQSLVMRFLSIAIVVSFVFGQTGIAMAAVSFENLPTETVYDDFVVGPGKVEVFMNPGETRTVELRVSNRLGRDSGFKFDIEDFIGSTDPSKTVVLLGNQRGPYSLRDYLDFGDERRVLIPHGKRATIPVTISIPSDAEPGGLYGSVLVSTVSEDSDRNDVGVKGGTAIVTRIGVLFFVRVAGDVQEEGEFIEFSTKGDKSFYLSGPVDMEILYENKGSIHLNPYGVLTITNMLGEVVGETPIDPWFTLPTSLRLREISWDRPLLVGRYKARAEINRGYEDIVDTKEITFWVIPVSLIGTVLVGIIIVLIIIRWITSNIEIKRKPKVRNEQE